MKMNMSNSCFIVVLGVYTIFSKVIFDYVYAASNLIIDEEFHLPLGEQYCKFHFDKWDPKVTTLPGLYLLSALLLGPLGLCSIYWLRTISLFLSCINLILFYILFSQHAKGVWQTVFSALMLALLPPLYFFSHVYYTDVISLTSNLLFIILSERGNHYSASIIGFFSVICRQTNVVFVGIYGGKYIVTQLYGVWLQGKNLRKKDGVFPTKNAIPFVLDTVKNPVKILKGMSITCWLNCFCYISVVVSFLAFVWFNGGIVVGDKNAHKMSIHIPQLFYFSVFCLVFGWPHFVGEVSNFMLFAKRHKLFICVLTVVACIIVHYNTLVHPYLLADNRHFVFYIWNRFYGKFWWFRYIMVPVYIFSLYVVIKIIWDRSDISFFMFYVPAVVLLLISQSLLEFRYFLVPYILLRIRIKNKDSAVFNVILELVTYCVFNMIVFKVFFTKTVTWVDYDFPQRIIW